MKYQINLLKQKKISFSQRIIYFGTNYLRYVLVLTQLLIIGVFFYKVGVDQDIVDITEAVNQKKEILTVSKPLIDQGYKINLKVNETQNILKKQEQFSQLLEYLLTKFPAGFVLSKFDMDGNTINFSGKTDKPQLLQLFYGRLQREGRFKNIQLSNIERKMGEVSFSFTLANFSSK